MLKNNLLLRVLNNEEVERPPIWLMRQAGRILPEYREVRKEIGSFVNLVKNPEMASLVTVQPVDHLDVDAAIIFSDILVIPEAMGMSYHMEKGVGPVMDSVISNESDIDNLLTGEDAAEKLDYVYEALEFTVKRLDGRVPLIGFAGAPWTLLCYMIEGRGSKTFSQARKFLRQNPLLAHKLIDKITSVIISYLNKKVEAGADVVQVFDSWAGLLDESLYEAFCLPYLRKICLEVHAPKIIFSKGAHFSIEQIAKLNCNAVGIDWTQSMKNVRNKVGSEKVLQGNIDPSLLYADPAKIKLGVEKCIRDVGNNHIVNLGHGVYPDTPLEGVKAMVQSVKNYEY